MAGPDDDIEPNVGLGVSPALTLDEFRLAFHQVHELLGLDDPLT